MKRLFSLVVMALILLGIMPGHKEAAVNAIASEPKIPVKLVNYLGNQSSISLKVAGSYSLTGTSTLLINNKTYVIKVENQKLGLYEGNTKLASGDKLTITPVNDSDRALINNRAYMGSFDFTVEGGLYVRPYNSLYMEDYLKSVVPAEMIASTWSKEALKAQAVAARSYALYWVNRQSQKISDTTSFQAYAGASNLHPNSTAAVDETAGEVLTYQNNLIEAIYSASNGGMTENNYNEFGTAPLKYFPIQADTYDTKVKWDFTIHKQQIDSTALDLSRPDTWWNQTTEVDSAITDKIKNYLYNNDYKDKQIKIVSIPKLTFSDKTESGRVQRGAITINFFVKGDVDSTGKLNLRTLEKPVTTLADTIRDIIGRTTMPSTLINKMEETTDAFQISGSGNGHGVGMSQHGANNRGNDGISYDKILEFYYPATNKLKQYEPVQKNTMKTGWFTQGNNKYYLDSNGNAALGWLPIGANWYFFNQNGTMATGWIKDGTKWYFLDTNGVMKTGWVNDGGTWYYLESSGAMKTGWVNDGGTWYYLASSGAMKTGWLKDGTAWYYLASSGAMKTGWLKDGSSWYYLYSSGVMATGWVIVGGSWYYLYPDGHMAANTTIQGYKLGASGAWIK